MSVRDGTIRWPGASSFWKYEKRARRYDLFSPRLSQSWKVSRISQMKMPFNLWPSVIHQGRRSSKSLSRPIHRPPSRPPFCLSRPLPFQASESGYCGFICDVVLIHHLDYLAAIRRGMPTCATNVRTTTLKSDIKLRVTRWELFCTVIQMVWKCSKNNRSR